ncbi:PAB-dependent poly(A)-specific ribonuclease subunit PAN3 [Orchesella cincta]|uniref:PAB-dependent poly(A)-specific ribonuclease subunit PAN3 n=1 Tax=Orchesella cincta TaxID=48709 RepID=A0A1D2MJE3_ORCCI|nr:PAB-dependent poly(A)-specific ribonuclease subunit PAN3 [Orchesella cincta]
MSSQWMDPENVGGTTYFYTTAQVEEAQNTVEEDPGGPLVFPSYSVYGGQPPPHMKDHFGATSHNHHQPQPHIHHPHGNSTGAGGGNGAGGGGGSERISNLGPPTNPIVHPTLPHHHQNSYFVPEEVKLELMHRSAVLLSQPNPSMYQEVPGQVDHYHELCPLEHHHHGHHPQKSSSFGYPSTVYKAVNSKNGFTYCLRRIHGFRLPSGKWLGLIEAWKQLNHCNLIQLREIFTTKAFADNSLIFVYDYFPMSDTLMARHFTRNSQLNGYVDPFSTGDPAVPRPYSHQRNSLLKHQANLLPENLLWAYIVQLAHAGDLPNPSLHPPQLLRRAGRDHLRSEREPRHAHALLPTRRLGGFGQAHSGAFMQLLVGRAEGKSSCGWWRSYSSDLRNLIIHLMNPRGASSRSINDIMPMIGARFYNQLDSANARAELLEHYLAKEIENGRLFRLLVKMNTIIERQELNQDPQWSETGDRYLLKLFRDYVFHQVSADGRPWLDMSHVIYTLNRLDAGTVEKVCLMSRDGQNGKNKTPPHVHVDRSSTTDVK